MKLFTVDAFTNQAFAGNPAAVCLLENSCSPQWMQQLASEIGYSETAYLLRTESGFELRRFTPAYEVDLCGHATLAAAHVLWQELNYPGAIIEFDTRSGRLVASHKENWIQLDFPSTPATECKPDPCLLEGLGTTAIFTGASKFDALVVLEREDQVLELQPDFELLSKVPRRGIIVTAPAADRFHEGENRFDFVSRFFAPSAGIDEDPVTGSAHCCLGPYWSIRLGSTELTGYQASRRGGMVRVECRDDRVLLGGQALTVMRGELAIQP